MVLWQDRSRRPANLRYAWALREEGARRGSARQATEAFRLMGYQLGDEFPREGFVQAALEQHFAACERVEAGWADLACVDENGVRWVIEAKGETSDTGLDFRTGLGQLL